MKFENTFELLSQGYTQKEIAEILNISKSQLEKYINSLKKMGAKTIFQLAVIIFKNK
jgi:DNA-binding CsgD family transcriptional regulator